jgi:hypothetical protein
MNNEDCGIVNEPVSKSPLPIIEEEVIVKKYDPSPDMGFADAVKLTITGARITRREWDDVKWFCLLKSGILHIHKSGEKDDTTRPWIISDGDVLGEDWYVI